MRVRSDFKKCTRCKRWLWKSKFPVDRNSKDGLEYWCYECISEYHRQYKIENRDVIRECNRKRCMKNREKINEQQRNWNANNREKINEQQRKRRIKNPEKKMATQFVSDAISRNGFPPPEKCIVCLSTENLNYHHESYEREHWLSVIPVCATCHQRLHVFYRAKKNNQTPVKGDEQIAQIVHEEFLSLYRREKECV